MDQEIEIINTETRKEKIKNFLVNNKKSIISLIIILLLIIFSFLFYQDYKKRGRADLADKYNLAIIQYESGDESKILETMKSIIEKKDKTYSPLAFYYLLDNDLISSKEEINKYFDVLINETKVDNENKNLFIFKKGLFNAEFANENELLGILNPLIKSESTWKPHALYLMSEYYFAKNEKQKSKEFLDQLVGLKNISESIRLEAQKRLRSDFSE